VAADVGSVPATVADRRRYDNAARPRGLRRVSQREPRWCRDFD